MWPLRRKPTPTTLESTTERELIGLARGGGGAAFGEIMRRNNRRLFRAARGIIGSDWEAEEVVQDAYVRAFRALATFRQEAALGTWLTRIVINEAQGRLRGRRETTPLTELDDNMGEIIQFPGGTPNADPERQAAISEIRSLLEGAIDALPSSFRAVFILRHVEGLSTEETAHLLSIEPETVKTRLHRARTRLQRALQDELAPALKDTFPFEGERCGRLTHTVLRRLGLSSEL